MLTLISIFIGGGLGAVLRYLTGNLFRAVFFLSLSPIFATLTVNIIGSFILGFVYAFSMGKISIPNELKLAITVGFCGGLTTFSTFSVESFSLFKEGEIALGLGYAILSVVSCIFFVWLGISLGNFTLKLFS